MNMLHMLLGKSLRTRKRVRKTLDQYKEELRIREGAEQFKKLINSGLQIPVGMM